MLAELMADYLDYLRVEMKVNLLVVVKVGKLGLLWVDWLVEKMEKMLVERMVVMTVDLLVDLKD